MTVSLDAAGGFAELVFHGLAFVDLRGDPANLGDARYVAWARTVCLPEAVDPLVRDAPTIAALYANEGARARALQALPTLHRGIAEFRATASRPVGAVHSEHVADAAVLKALRRSDPALVELTRGALLLAAPTYARAYTATIAPTLRASVERVRAGFEAAAEVFAPLGSVRVFLSSALGAHGRVFGDDVYVGAPLAWCGDDPAWCVVQALHESAVRAQGEGDYTRVEWGALAALARALHTSTAVPAWLREAHERWLGAHSFEALALDAARVGLADEATARAVAFGAGPERLRALSAHTA